MDYVIPGNDDAIRAIKLISSIIADAVIAAKEGLEELPKAEDEEAAAEVMEAVEVEAPEAVVEEKE